MAQRTQDHLGLRPAGLALRFACVCVCCVLGTRPQCSSPLPQIVTYATHRMPICKIHPQPTPQRTLAGQRAPSSVRSAAADRYAALPPGCLPCSDAAMALSMKRATWRHSTLLSPSHVTFLGGVQGDKTMVISKVI